MASLVAAAAALCGFITQGLGTLAAAIIAAAVLWRTRHLTERTWPRQLAKVVLSFCLSVLVVAALFLIVVRFIPTNAHH